MTGQLQPVQGGGWPATGSVPVVFIHGIISGADMWKASTPGSIGIPVAVAKTINRSLSSASKKEQVAF